MLIDNITEAFFQSVFAVGKDYIEANVLSHSERCTVEEVKDKLYIYMYPMFYNCS